MIFLSDKIHAVIEGLFLLFILLIITSCNGLEPKHRVTVERCFPLMEVVAKDEDGSDVIKGICQCHSYRVGDEIKRVSESESKPLMYCNKEALFKDYPNTLYPFLKEWSIFLLQQQK